MSISEQPCRGCWACQRPAGPCGSCWAPGFIGPHDNPRPCPVCKTRTHDRLIVQRGPRQ